jgi:hypothetical protein
VKYIRNLIFILLLMPSSGAIAQAYRCTDAQGKVTYTNTECEAGTDVQSVKDTTNLINTSKERRFFEQELARAKAKVGNLNEGTEPEIATTNQIANLEKLKQADSLIKTAIAAREQLWMLAVILIATAAILLFIARIFRRRKKRYLPAERELPIPR